MFKSYLLIAVLLIAGTAATAQQYRRLNEGWEFLRMDLGSPWEAVRPVAAGGAESVPLWTNVMLPHCYNAQDAVDPDVNYYQGPAWYRTRIDINNPYKDGRTILHFEGSGQKTSVYIYTTLVGQHTGGYDEFSIDITNAVDSFRRTTAVMKQFKGLVPVSIRTDNSRDAQMIPSSLSDFTIYGGIYRYLNLVYEPAVFISEGGIVAGVDEKGKQGMLKLTPVFLFPATGHRPDSLHIKIMDPSGRIVINKTYNTSDSIIAIINKPLTWSPANPQRYKAELSIGAYTFTQHFGFRNFEFVTHGPFRLNGKRLLLRGTHRHEDHAGVGAAMTEDMMRAEMISMKEMGVNFIRLGHYQQSRIILDLCDSLGIIVWEEIPWCRGGIGGDTYQQQAKDMLRNMISQHRHHPSIIIWGLGNENDWPGDFPVFDTLAIRKFMTELNELSHTLDPSRKTAIRRCDFCKDIVDVYSPSIWAGWYRGIYTEYKSISYAEMQKVDHFLHVEWGGDSHAGRHSENPDKGLQAIKPVGKADERTGDASLYGGAARVSKDGDWSESYICNLVDWHLREQENMPWLTGSAQWPFKDFATPLRPDNPVPYVNQKGAVTRDGTPKESYYVYQSYWASKPMIHIYAHSWPTRWGAEGEQKMIKVYSNCKTAELIVNGRSQGKRKRNSQDFPAGGLRWELPLNKGVYEVIAIGTSGKNVVRDTIRFNYETSKWGKATGLGIAVLDNDQSIAHVEVTLLDSNQVTCLDSSSWTRFGITGVGELMDDLGTPTGSRYVQMTNGRARIGIRLNNGKSVVSAVVKGQPVAMLTLDGNAESEARLNSRTSIIGQADDAAAAKVAWALAQKPVTVTSETSPRSAGGRHDFFSEGDYWWPDPVSPDSPYIQKDGLTNPANFTAHRKAMIRFSQVVGTLGTAWIMVAEKRFEDQILAHAKAWFIDTATRMNPNLLYAQAIKGRATGRGIGIIDAIQLMEVVKVLELIETKVQQPELYTGFRSWFADYLTWVTTHPYGLDERNANNNHGTCWVMQVSVFAGFTRDNKLLEMCAQRYKEVLLPRQMATDGSFPLELKRTKPYGYSIFNLDAMATICQELSAHGIDLWHYQTSDGKSIRKGIAFLYPFIRDKTSWTFPKDVMYWNDWPVAQPFLVFGGLAFNEQDWLTTWGRLDHDPGVEEVIRNLPVRNPLVWTTDAPQTGTAVIFKDAARQTDFMLKEIPLAMQASPDLVSPRTLENGKLKLVASRDWTSGFFPGELWFLYEYTQDTSWRTKAQTYTALIEREKTNGGTHDMGFKIWCSFGNGWKLTHNEAYKAVIIDAARTLVTRFNPKTGVIRSWDNRAKWANPVIIDNMMNLELLFEATRLSGDSIFYKVAVSHANTTMQHHFRPDNSSYHVVDYDTATGAVLQRTTHQGFADSSAWSRGQAWGVYGFTMCYRYTKDPAYLLQAEKIATYMLDHPNMPKDLVPYWDYNAPNIPDEERDVSAAAVLASALYELSSYSKDGKVLRNKANIILNSLTKRYRSPVGENSGFILLHSVGSKPAKSEVDVPLSYADYYYLEAVLRSR